ncbi:unnamed protein product [Linum tenue]|uniref:Uncharacterized protein n=1 Tax=Linum tenue TaxID=586396 RepID=A0AAV0NAG3_9ROSI|nr:unnamed protein product [Linum tenue]
MLMAPFELNSTIHFVASSDSRTIDVYELTTSKDSPPSAVKATDWKIVANVTVMTSHHQQEGDGYDALKLFDEVITGRDLRNLAEDLSRFHFYVNPLGNTFIHVSAGGGEFIHPAFGVQFFRLNDTFNWSQYGAFNPPPAEAKLWHTRHGFSDGDAVVDYKKQLKAKDEKLVELKTELRSKTADLESEKRELDKYRKWCSDFRYRYRDTISASEAAAKIRRRRVKVARSTFVSLSPPVVPNSPVRCRVPSFKEEAIDAFWLLDEDCGGFPPPPAVQVWTADGKFDAENWWCIKANRRVQGGGETTMLVYYDGKFDYAEFYNPMTSRRERVPVPYKVKDGGMLGANRNFSVGYFSFTWEVRVVFTYRW